MPHASVLRWHLLAHAGHDIRLTVHLDAGMEVFDLHSTLHEIRSVSTDKGRATVTLAHKAEIPNKDFICATVPPLTRLAIPFFSTDARGTFFHPHAATASTPAPRTRRAERNALCDRPERLDERLSHRKSQGDYATRHRTDEPA